MIFFFLVCLLVFFKINQIYKLFISISFFSCLFAEILANSNHVSLKKILQNFLNPNSFLVVPAKGLNQYLENEWIVVSVLKLFQTH